jgi:hypothetical protein
MSDVVTAFETVVEIIVRVGEIRLVSVGLAQRSTRKTSRVWLAGRSYYRGSV